MPLNPVTKAGRQVNPHAVLGVFCLGLFMTLLDLTIVNIAIPKLVDDLHASLGDVLWVQSAYSLLYAVLLITSGRLGDIIGPRAMFLIGTVVFTIGSAGSGLAQSPGMLIAFRAVQGLGAAIMAPQGLPMITTLLPPEKRGGSFAAIGAMSGLAVLAGPVLGGLLVSHVGWRWIFYLNLPIGAITFVLAMITLPTGTPGRRHRLDLTGVILLTVGLLGIVYGLIDGQHYNWGTVTGFITIPYVIAAGCVMIAIFLWRQARLQNREPLVPFALFHDRNFSLMILVLAGMGFTMVGIFLPLTIYYQSVLGLSALAAGLTVAPQALAMMVASSICGAMSEKINGKFLLIPGLLAFAGGMAYVAFAASAGAGRWAFLPGLLVSGAGIGCVWIPVFGIATRDLRPELAGVASGVLSTLQELGTVIGTASIGALLQNRLAVGLRHQAAHYSSAVPAQYRSRFVSGFAHTTLDVGAGQAGGASLPSGPAGRRIAGVAQDVFAHGFVGAMRPAMVLPIAVLVVVALSCFFVRSKPAQVPVPEEPVAVS
jgi:EmrB/QacA subfamily drug resistance transporter